MLYLKGTWRSGPIDIQRVSYICGYCGKSSGPSRGYVCKYIESNYDRVSGYIYICPTCNKPTFITLDEKEQVPGPRIGDEIAHLPNDIQNLYNEARKCLQVNAPTSATLSCRKLLMNITVSKGAKTGESFAYYVTYLENNRFIPPNSKEWVDHIRKKGNEATHEIANISEEDAVELLGFVEMLLRFVYEMPGRMLKYSNKK